MKTMIENYVNRNLRDARKQASKFSRVSIRKALREKGLVAEATTR